MREKEITELMDKGKKAFNDFDFNGAYKEYKAALDILNHEAESSKKKKLWTQVYREIIQALDKGGKWLNALEYAGILISQLRIKGEKRLEIEARLMSCRILLNHGNWKEAKKRFQAVIELAEKSGSKEDVAECHYGLAYIEWRKGDMDAARFRNSKALRLLKGKPVSYLECKAIILNGSIEDTIGNTKGAIVHFEESIKKLKILGPTEDLARAYNNLGEAYKGIENFESAARQYEECVKVSEKVHTKRGALYGLSNTAECYAFLGKTKEARAITKKVERILKEAPEKYIMAQIHYIKGLVSVAEREPRTATKEYEVAIRELNKMGSPPYDLGIVYFRLGEVLMDLEQKDRADEAFHQARKYLKEADAKLYLEKLDKAVGK
jgi:tetratricopeptide (TPR) repeat protein